MKRRKTLLILVVILAVVSAAAFAAARINSEAVSEEETDAVPLLSFDTESVSALSFAYGDRDELSFAKADDSWSYAEDSAFPLYGAYVDNMVDAAALLSPLKTIDAPESLADYGLEDPSLTVSVTAGEDYEILVGDETELDGERYVSIGDGKVYLVDADILSSFDYELYDLIEKESVPAMQDVSRFTVTSGKKSYELDYIENSGLAYSDEYVWFYKNGDEDYMTLDTALTSSFIAKVTGIEWGDCVDYKADEASLADYGLDTLQLTVTVEYTETTEYATNMTDSDGQTIYETRETPSSFTLEIGSYSGDYCYARIAGSSMVYLIDADICDSLMYVDYVELQPDEVLVMDFDEVTSVDIMLGGESYTVKRSSREETDEDGNTSTVSVWTLDGEEIDIQDVFDSLTELYPNTSGAAKTPTREAELSFTFHRSTEKFEEVELAFYPYSSTDCLTSLNGEARLTITRSEADSIKEDLAALLEK